MSKKNMLVPIIPRMCFQGYNQEDSILPDRSSIDRPIFQDKNKQLNNFSEKECKLFSQYNVKTIAKSTSEYITID
jgi:DNA-directed RNA polymerase beta subunit